MYGRVADYVSAVLPFASHPCCRHADNEYDLLSSAKLITSTDIHSDYVSAVVGIFIVFVAVLWLFKRKSYQGPVSLCGECLVPAVNADRLATDIRHGRFSFASIHSGSHNTCRETLLGSLCRPCKYSCTY